MVEGQGKQPTPGSDPQTGIPGGLLMVAEEEISKVEPEQVVDALLVAIRLNGGEVQYLTSPKFQGTTYKFDRHKAYQIICTLKLELEAEIQAEAVLGALSESANTATDDSH